LDPQPPVTHIVEKVDVLKQQECPAPPQSTAPWQVMLASIIPGTGVPRSEPSSPLSWAASSPTVTSPFPFPPSVVVLDDVELHAVASAKPHEMAKIIWAFLIGRSSAPVSCLDSRDSAR
jgi:hypothetical protein